MIKNSSSSTNENIDTSSELISLLVNRNTAIYSKYIEFIVKVFLSIEFFGDLEGKLSSWGKDHGLNSAAAKCLVFS